MLSENHKAQHEKMCYLMQSVANESTNLGFMRETEMEEFINSINEFSYFNPQLQ
jgi:hypothetical protein